VQGQVIPTRGAPLVAKGGQERELARRMETWNMSRQGAVHAQAKLWTGLVRKKSSRTTYTRGKTLQPEKEQFAEDHTGW